MQDLYLNHAGTSWPKPEVVLKAVAGAFSADPATWSKRFHEAHQAIADFFGVENAQQILLTPGCTSALSVGIADAFIPPGMRLITSRWEHHAVHRPLLKRGIPLNYAPPEGGEINGSHASLIDLELLETELATGDVGMIAITAACNVTGDLLPFGNVIQMAHRHGCMVLIDAAQIVGWVEIDLPRLGADMVAFGGHKGLQGPWGIGGLFLSQRAKMECASATCELPAANTSGRQNTIRPSYCDAGSVDQCALAGLHASIKMLSEQDLDANLARARKQIQRIRQMLESFDGIHIYGASKNGMPTIAIAIAGLSSAELATHFKRHRIQVGSGFQCAPLAHELLGTQETGLVRLSVGVGQPDDEIDEAIERIQLVLSEEILRQTRAKSGRQQFDRRNKKT